MYSRMSQFAILGFLLVLGASTASASTAITYRSGNKCDAALDICIKLTKSPTACYAEYRRCQILPFPFPFPFPFPPRPWHKDSFSPVNVDTTTTTCDGDGELAGRCISVCVAAKASCIIACSIIGGACVPICVATGASCIAACRR